MASSCTTSAPAAGEPLILLHGGQGDYRSWEPQIAELSRYYHVISYSRRYNFPNENPQTATNHSVLIEAADLAALIKALKPEACESRRHIDGCGDCADLAVQHPKLVRSLVLAEPPLLAWAQTFSRRQRAVRRFHEPHPGPGARSFRGWQ